MLVSTLRIPRIARSSVLLVAAAVSLPCLALAQSAPVTAGPAASASVPPVQSSAPPPIVPAAASSTIALPTPVASNPVAAIPASSSAGDAATPPPSDHHDVVGHWAVAYFGTPSVAIGVGTYAPTGPGLLCGVTDIANPGAAGAAGAVSGQAPNLPCTPMRTGEVDVPAPTVGVRYWFSERRGMDLAVGLGYASGSSTQYPYSNRAGSDAVAFEASKPTLWAVLLHAGLPFAVRSRRHLTLEVIPSVTLAYGRGKQNDEHAPPPNVPSGPVIPATPERDALVFSGTRVSAELRAGGELHFGFIGVPELSLLGTVGVEVARKTTSVSTGKRTASESSTTVQTTIGHMPWDVFKSNTTVAALYYF